MGSPAAWAVQSTTGTELDFSGTLVDEPCTVAVDDTDIQLDFGSIIDKGLYDENRSPIQPFTIHLVDCNIDEWGGSGDVTTRFEGTQSVELPGYLALNDASMGVAIGINEADGSFLGLGKNSQPQKLADGSLELNYEAFVQVEPTAQEKQSIALGSFSATATFFLEYP